MPHCEHGATDIRRPHRSRLGESLLRLHQNFEQNPDQSRTPEQIAAAQMACEPVLDDQFGQWQERWSDRKEQISRRLELIDRQLENLVQMHQRRPQLSVVTAHSHDDEPVAP